MATITNTLIHGLTNKMVQARLNAIDAKSFLFGTYFPVKKVNGFSWATLTNQLEKGNIAADIHADNATIVRKARPVLESARGDIPFISISREMTRAEMKEYQVAQALQGDTDAAKLVEYWGGDVDFCFNGIQSELEYIAWQLVSNAGVINFTTANNATFANEFNLDYSVSDENKATVGTDWSDTTADIIGDLAGIIKNAKDMGLNPKYAFVNLDEFYKISTNEEIKKMGSTLAQAAAGIYMPLDVTQVNQILGRQAWLNGIQLIVVDQTITRELANGTRTSANPFADARLVLSEGNRLGSTQYDILQEQNPVILRAERSHTIIKKYGQNEPLAEITVGHADALPVFDTAYRNIYVKTDGTEW